MKIAIVLNGISLDKKVFYSRFLPALSSDFPVEVFETRSENDAIHLASESTDKGFDVVLAAGGDGTVNQVVNGVLRNRENSNRFPVVGILPIGTGNDLARGLELRADVFQLMSLLRDFKPRKFDVGKVTFTTNEGNAAHQYFVNVADIGMGPEVVRKVLKSNHLFGSAVSYYQSILKTFFTYKPMMVHARLDDWEWKGKVRTLAAANSKFYGHGLCIAPGAKPDDGIFDVFICGNASVLDFVLQSGKLKNKKMLSHKMVQYRQAKIIDLRADSTCAIEADGEFLGFLPARIELLPQKLKFLI